MADHKCSVKSSQPLEDHQARPASSFLGSPRMFRNLLTNSAENVMNPTSILDTRHIFGLKSPSGLEKKVIKSSETSIGSRHPWDHSGSTGIGLAIITSDNEGLAEDSSKITTRVASFGSQLKIQVPPFSPTMPPSTTELPRSPSEFGTKTRNLAMSSPSSSFRKRDAAEVLTRQLSVTEMELSEDYTCVITYGPNPKTTHIFDNYIVGSYGGALSPLESRTGCFLPDAENVDDASGSLYYTCKKDLGLENANSIYRESKAYCSQVCTNQEMHLSEAQVPVNDAYD